MNRRVHIMMYFLLTGLLTVACQQENIITNPEILPEKPSVIPADIETLPNLYIETPSAIVSKEDWIPLSKMTIEVRVNGKDSVVYQSDSLKIKGRGNSTWQDYPKKPYALKLIHKENLIGTGKTSRWVLLSNWMDRTLLRNQVAFEMARRSSLEWTPSGVFVNLYLNNPAFPDQAPSYQGIYWLGEKIRVEGSHFTADYLYSYDTSDKTTADYTAYCHAFSGGEWKDTEVPVTLKYPDRDDYPLYYWISYLQDASLNALQEAESAIYHAPSGEWLSKIDLNSFCDWYLVNEVCNNAEVRHPKSVYFYIRDGIMYAGPVWDFDYGTFRVTEGVPSLRLKSSLYYYHLFPVSAFRKRLQARWNYLRPQFEQIAKEYIDEQADWIRESEKANYEVWGAPYPNPLATEENNFMVNMDEDLTFDEAVAKMKAALRARIKVLDELIAQL